MNALPWHWTAAVEEGAALEERLEAQDPDYSEDAGLDEFRSRMVNGATFVLDAPDAPPAVWGSGTQVAWAQGEALTIVGGNGVGKTTLAGQLVRGRLGLDVACLDLPIVPGVGSVLYLAMDRPSQVRRALARAFSHGEGQVLADRLVVWQGPPPHDLAKHTGVLAEMCRAARADTVVVDSLKDAAVGLSEDEVGAGWNRARQRALVDGVEVIELHHNVKRSAASIDDVFGSVWLTAGAGSVLGLIGEPGDPIVQVRHLKQPADEVGPWRVIHDHEHGRSTIWHGVDLARAVTSSPAGITAKAAAALLFEVEKPTAAQVEKARRRLERLVTSGEVERFEGSSSTVYRAVTDELVGVGR